MLKPTRRGLMLTATIILIVASSFMLNFHLAHYLVRIQKPVPVVTDTIKVIDLQTATELKCNDSVIFSKLDSLAKKEVKSVVIYKYIKRKTKVNTIKNKPCF